MGVHLPGWALSGRRSGNMLRAALLAGAITPLLAATASAAPVATPLVRSGDGLTVPSGVAVTPDGGLWVSDELHGLCRVADTAADEPAQHGRLVLDEFCAPEPPAAPHPPAGAPEPPAPEPTRPTGTFQIAFDASGCEPGVTLPDDTARCNFYVAEGTSGGSGVWRMHWNPDTKVIDAATKIYVDFSDLRVTGLSLTPDGDVDFSTKRDTFIRRLESPATAAKDSYVNPPSVGFSQAPGVAALAHVGQALYLAEGAQLTTIPVPSTSVAGGGTAQPVPGLPAGVVVTALAGDGAEGTLYAGTNSDKLEDSVYAVRAGAVAQYDSGFANVTSLSVGSAGELYVADDPSAAAGVVNPSDQGRVFRRARGSLDPPRVTLTATPAPFSSSGAPADAAIRFQSRAGATTACTFAAGAAAPAPVDCPVTAEGAGEFAPAATLAEGTYHFTVQATASGDTGPVTRYDFTVDTTPPSIAITPGSSSIATGGAISVGFSAGEVGVVFECRLDAGLFQLCTSPKSYAGLALGEHTLEVRATDAAGNTGAATSWAFTSVAAPPEPAAPVAPSPPPAPAVPDAPGAIAPAPAPAPRTTAEAPPAPVQARVATRPPQQDIHVPCAAVSPARQRAGYRLAGVDALVRFRAPGQARYAKFTLRRGTTRTGAKVVETLGYAAVRTAGATHSIHIPLTASQRRALRLHRMQISVAYGTCRTQVGAWTSLLNADTKGTRG
jgi:hypothetical protein